MNKIERQILRNQLWLIKNTSAMSMRDITEKQIIYDEMRELLNKKKPKENKK